MLFVMLLLLFLRFSFHTYLPFAHLLLRPPISRFLHCSRCVFFNTSKIHIFFKFCMQLCRSSFTLYRYIYNRCRNEAERMVKNNKRSEGKHKHKLQRIICIRFLVLYKNTQYSRILCVHWSLLTVFLLDLHTFPFILTLNSIIISQNKNLAQILLIKKLSDYNDTTLDRYD